MVKHPGHTFSFQVHPSLDSQHNKSFFTDTSCFVLLMRSPSLFPFTTPSALNRTAFLSYQNDVYCHFHKKISQGSFLVQELKTKQNYSVQKFYILCLAKRLAFFVFTWKLLEEKLKVEEEVCNCSFAFLQVFLIKQTSEKEKHNGRDLPTTSAKKITTVLTIGLSETDFQSLQTFCKSRSKFSIRCLIIQPRYYPY